jgi:hypothetical protein
LIIPVVIAVVAIGYRHRFGRPPRPPTELTPGPYREDRHTTPKLDSQL